MFDACSLFIFYLFLKKILEELIRCATVASDTSLDKEFFSEEEGLKNSFKHGTSSGK